MSETSASSLPAAVRKIKELAARKFGSVHEGAINHSCKIRKWRYGKGTLYFVIFAVEK